MYTQPTIVVGTGRSGTSMVSGMLSYMGVFMGRDLIKADQDNPAGYWEDRRFKELNIKVLEDEIEPEEFKEEATKLINARATRHKKWGWKVPSTAQLLGLYLDLGVIKDPKIIWCDRNEEDVINSMKRCYDWSEKHSKGLVDARKGPIKRCIEKYDLDVLKLDFEKVINDPEEVAAELINFVDLKPDQEEIERAVDLIVEDKPDEDTKIMVAMPNTGWTRIEVAKTMTHLSHDQRYTKQLISPQAVPYELNINQTVKKFLESDEDFDYLLLLDTDNPPLKSPFDLVELDKDIIGMSIPTVHGKTIHPAAMDRVGNSFKAIPASRRQGLQEVDAVGSGCMLISRRVLEDIKAPFKPTWNEDGTSRITGDFNFCTRAKEKGYKVWVHWDYSCDHIKENGLKQVMEMSMGSNEV